MKKTVNIILSACFMLLASCSWNGKSNNQATIQHTSTDVDFPDSIQKMQEMHFSDTVTWNDGTLYLYDIHRKPDTSLAMIEDEHHIHYVDNSIVLTIKKNGNPTFCKTFTKEAFMSLLDEDFRVHGILEGLGFDKIVPQGLQFAASISDPSQDDWYMPFLVTISGNSIVSIKRDPTLDSGSPQSSNEEDGV